MSDFRKGFFVASRRQELRTQQNYEEIKKLQKITNDVKAPISEELLRKQTKPALHQEVSEINPSGQRSKEQFIKVVLNIQEEIMKLRKENLKLTELISNGFQYDIDLRMANQERKIDTKRIQQRYQFSQKNSKFEKIQKQSQKIESEFQNQNKQPQATVYQIQKNGNRTNSIISNSNKQIAKKKENCNYCLKEGLYLNTAGNQKEIFKKLREEQEKSYCIRIEKYKKKKNSSYMRLILLRSRSRR